MFTKLGSSWRNIFRSMAKILSKNMGKSGPILDLALIQRKNSQSQKSEFSEFVLQPNLTLFSIEGLELL